MTAAAGVLPTGKIGDLEITRMILGGNLLTRYNHARDLGYVYSLIGRYNTDEKIMETMAVAEDNGIGCMSIYTVDWAVDLVVEHRRRGGRMKWIHCPTSAVDGPSLDDYRDEVAQLAERGVDAFYVWGEQTDELVADGKTDVIGSCLEIIKACGVPAGIGGHALETVQACEQGGIDCDFYVKTLHHHDYPSAPAHPERLEKPQSEVPPYWCRNPQETVDYMQGVDKPWIAFKTMAAGSIQPQSAFEYAFRNGADFVFAGMLDYEIEPDVAIAVEVLQQVMGSDRARPWHG